MISLQANSLLILLQSLLLFFISRESINEIFYYLRKFFRSDSIIYSLVSIFFLPGTIVHELSHFFMAMILFLNVREIHIFPKWEGNHIKLGRVIYEKKDFLRGIMVGIAPIITGFIFLFSVSTLKIFPSQNLLLNILIIYSILVITSTMFSSKQDLVDIVFILPVFLIVGAVIYIFNIDLSYFYKNQQFVTKLSDILLRINWYLFLSLSLHIIFIVVLKLIGRKK